MTLDPWAALLVTGAAVAFLGVTGAMGVWYSLRFAWWTLAGIGRGAWWLACLVGDTACDIDQRRRDHESARRWRSQHGLGWNSGAGLERLRTEAEAMRPRDVGEKVHARITAAASLPTLAEAGAALARAGRIDLAQRREEQRAHWITVDHEASVAPSPWPISAQEGYARRRWIVERARLHGGGIGSIQLATKEWENTHRAIDRMLLRTLSDPARTLLPGEAEHLIILAERVHGVTVPTPECDCEPDEFDMRSNDGTTVARHVQHEAHCTTRRDPREVAEEVLARIADSVT